MPVLGVIFLRHATNRFDAAVRQIEADPPAIARQLVDGTRDARRSDRHAGR